MSKGIDLILGEITVIQLALVEDQLSHNEVSSDEELQEMFVESGMTEEQAKQALTYRQRYSMNSYEIGSTPIRNGDDAYRFNPHVGAFEREGPNASLLPQPPGKKRKS